ncbi:hypothetical protein N8987_05755 [Crocinitomix sp.]|nr:hypothetical protein [Crocinitomix sp.]
MNLKVKRYILFILMVLVGASFIKPGQLKKIIRTRIVLDVSEIYPGNTFEVALLTTLRDSTKIRSQASNFTINFADFDFEILNGAELVSKSRTLMTLKVSDWAFTNPVLDIKATLRRKPSINHHIKIPIRYDLTQVVSYRGENGYDPRSTTDNGYKKIPITKRVNLEFIDNEQTLTNNSDPAIQGEKGPDLDIYISMKDTLEKAFVHILIFDEYGGEVVKTLMPDIGRIEIESLGGKGGISRSGGKGGTGGNVTVYIRKSALPYFDQIFILNNGGEGGELWRPEIDGQKLGPYGDDGEIKIIDWVD